MARGSIDLGIVSKFDNRGVSKAQSAFKKFGTAAAGIAAAAIGAVAGIGTAAVRMANEFEQSFAKVQGLVGVSTAEIETLKTAAAELGPQFGKSAQEAADALFFITSAGLRGADAVDVLEASLKASAAGLGDTNAIANAATAAMNTYGSEVLTGSQAVDALTEAVRLGQFAPEELAGSLGRVIPISSELGVSFQETTGLIAALTRGGLSATESVTGVRGAMQALLKPTGEAASMLQQYGFSTDEVRAMIEEDGLLATFQTLRDAFGENEEDFTRVIGSIEGLNAVLALTGENGDTVTDIVNQMTDGVGVLDEAFGAVEETAGFKFSRAMETAKASMLAVGDTLLGLGASLLDGLQPTLDMLGPMLTEMFSYLEQPLLDLVAVLPTLFEALMPLMPILGQFAGIFVDLVVAVLPVFVALIEMIIPILEAFMPVIQTVVDIFAMFMPILVSIIEIFTTMLEAILPLFLELWQALEEPLLKVIDALVIILEAILPVLAVFIEDVLTPILLFLAEVFGILLVISIEALADALQWLAEKMQTHGQNFYETWWMIQVGLVRILNKIIENVENLINRFIDGINRMIQAYNVFALLARKPLAVELDYVELPTLEEPGRFDYLVFPEVDTSGISDVASRRASMGGGNTSALQEMQGLFSGGTGFTGGSNWRSIGVPGMAEGGIVKAIRGGILANIGEGRYDEAVIPLRNGMGLGNTYNITVQAGVGDPVRIGEEVVTVIKRYERASGPVFASA